MGSAMGKDQPLKKARKHLSADALFRHLYAGFEQVPDGQPPDASISLVVSVKVRTFDFGLAPA